MSSNPGDGIVRLYTTQPVADVLRHLLAILGARGITVFAVVDHSGEAARGGMQMPETRLVIFGRPEAGTPVMLAAPDSALDLPLKILIAALPEGTTQVSYNAPSYLQARYNLPENLVGNIAAIEQIAATLVARQT